MDKKIERIKITFSNLWELKFLFVPFAILLIIYIIILISYPIFENINFMEHIILTSMAFITAILIIGNSSPGNL